jgi:ADP-L-glycero-D-manno-heptose 6-epimerase
MSIILVTGAQGFIGSKLVETLEIDESHQIHTIEETIFEDNKWVENLKNKLGEIKPEVIFHVGACSDTLEQNVNYMMTRNFESTKILVDYSKSNNIPLIYSSSAANYGTNGFYPSNLYGWSKYVAEQYVISNGGIALRYFNVYGPGEHNKGRMASVAYQMYIKNLNKSSIRLFPGRPLRDFIYVKDVVDVNIFAWENYENNKGRFYEVGIGETNGFEEVLNFMEIPFDYVDESNIPEGYQFYTCSDSSKWMKGWVPKWNLENGIIDYKKFLSEEYESR